MYEPIIDALRRGAAEEALEAARAAVAEQPQDPDAHRLLGMSLRLAGDITAATAAIDHAIALAPEDADLHLARAGLLLQDRQLDAAQAALARSVGLDPNQFPAYILQAQLAIGRGDLDEAERLARSATRIAPGHPLIAAIEGTLALRRGDPDRALVILTQASERAPDEPQLRHALGFAYLAKGHFAFAEQAFRGMLERDPGSQTLQMLIADVLRRQGRHGEAADELAKVLDQTDTPMLQRLVAMLELGAGRTTAALARLRPVAADAPGDRQTLATMLEAWRRLDDQTDARTTLDALLSGNTGLTDLWLARLSVERPQNDPAAALAVARRWHEAMPDSLPANEALLALLDAAGEPEQAEAIALAITELEPGHTRAELRVIDGLMQRDTDGAMARLESLLARAEDPMVRRSLRQLVGRTLDIAGQHEAAAATWAEVHAEVVAERLPLVPPSAPITQWPEHAPLPDPAPGVLLLWGAPGSLVERVAAVLQAAGTPIRADRYGSTPPGDAMQSYGTPQALVDGSLQGADLVALWRQALGDRQAADGNIIDWLLWWDNALLLALRPHLPEAQLLVALRDPRDMLLEWLASGSPAPFALESPLIGAQWLAQVLGQVADLQEQSLFPHLLLKLDDIANDPTGLAQEVANALQIRVIAPSTSGPVKQGMAAGHWRQFSQPLAEAFAVLTPVAVRLGYPEA
ncbi:MAG: tetratricopeptide repeat protein [Pseudomonadota bacterium]|nr:tetratricopeptide repeat protein [Pseudomonadota bacterium]